MIFFLELFESDCSDGQQDWLHKRVRAVDLFIATFRCLTHFVTGQVTERYAGYSQFCWRLGNDSNHCFFTAARESATQLSYTTIHLYSLARLELYLLSVGKYESLNILMFSDSISDFLKLRDGGYQQLNCGNSTAGIKYNTA